MQTFLPYPDFIRSAQCLDNRRLGKQRVECLQILKTLAKGPLICKLCKHPVSHQQPQKQHDPAGNCVAGMFFWIKTPWYNHPAVKMWRGYEGALVEYAVCVCCAWTARGFQDTCLEKLNAFTFSAESCKMPSWLGSAEFHASHRSNLLRKDFAHYSQFKWTEPTTLPYVWPVK